MSQRVTAKTLAHTASLVIKSACALVAAATLGSCTQDDPPTKPVPLTQVNTDRTYVRDAYGRYVFFHGINVSGATKAPPVDPTTNVADYTQTPFPLDSARREFKKLRDRGFNSVRLLVMWEAIEPQKRGEYDENYLNYIQSIVKIANEYGIYVLLDMHQDMFSRHAKVRFNSHPKYGEVGSLEWNLTSLIEPYDSEVKGDGAPLWVAQACLYEKNFASPHWGYPRIVSGLGPEQRAKLIQLYEKLTASGSSTGQVPDWIQYISDNAPQDFPPNETTDMLPFTDWGISAALSIDIERLFACMLAGDVAFPDLKVEDQNIKDYLQDAYAASWAKVAEKVKGLPNVMGYDLMNEPEGNFLILTAVAGAMQLGIQDGAKTALTNILGTDKGPLAYDVLMALRLMPPDTTPDTLKLWGLDKANAMNLAGLTVGFDRKYMAPFYSKVGKAIQAVDPKAIIYIEPSANITAIMGSGALNMWDQSMLHPDGVNQLVYAPHNYADLYPLGSSH